MFKLLEFTIYPWGGCCLWFTVFGFPLMLETDETGSTIDYWTSYGKQRTFWDCVGLHEPEPLVYVIEVS